MRNALAIIGALSVAALWPSVHAQQAGRQATPTFRSEVSLVTIDVTVLDKDGKPVAGLTGDDIDIKLNGKLQPIRALAYVQASPTPAKGAEKPAVPAAAPPPAPIVTAAPDAPRRTISNASAPSAKAATPAESSAPKAPPAPPAESRVFILLVDDLSYPPLRGKAMFNAASRFLDRIPTTDLVGFTTTTGVGAVNPTRDRAAIRAALSKVVGAFSDPRGLSKSGSSSGASQTAGNGSPDSPLGISESIDIERGDDALLQDVIIRECYNGVRSAWGNRSVPEVIANDQCASNVQREARTVAALSRQNKGRQIQGVLSVINAMKIATGIRHLVLLTEGLPVSREVDELNPLVRAAALAGVQLSVLLEEPDVSLTDEGRRALDPGAVPQTDPGASRRRRDDNMLLVNGAHTMSDMLGGTFYRVVGSPDPSFDKVIVASSAVYRLGVELPTGTTAGKDFTVSVSVKRPGLTAKANRFAVAALPDAAPAGSDAPAAAKPAATDASGAPIDPSKIMTGRVLASIDDVLKAALNSNTASSDVPMRIAATLRRSSAAAGQVDVSVNVVIPASVKGPITTFVGIVDSTGAVRNSRRVLEPSAGAEYAVPYLFPLAPGDYRIRFVASDATGVMGTIELPIRATLSPFGAFTASDVLTWVVDSGDKAQLFAIEDVPQGVDALHASIELYPAGAMPGEPPTVRWTLLREGEATPVDADEGPARPAATLMRADAEFAWADLPAGLYTVRAELLVDDKPVGVRAAVVRKR